MRSIRAASLAVVAVALIGSAVRADTFTLKDGRQVSGRVLAEFRDHYFVVVESELPRFLARADVQGILDDEGQARVDRERARPPTPAFAVANTVGEVKLHVRGTAKDVSAVEFTQSGDRLVTADAALARLAFPSGAVVNVGPATTLAARLRTDGVDAVDLEAGELLVTSSAVQRFDVALAGALTVRGQENRFEVARERATAWRISVHAGDARVDGPTFRATVARGHALRIEDGPGGTRLSADALNTDPLEVTSGSRQLKIAPGDTLTLEGTLVGARNGATWKLTRFRGSVTIRRADSGSFVEVRAQDVEQIRLASGDLIRTSAGSDALLTREDGAQCTAAEGSELALEPLRLLAGGARVEALAAPLRVETPGGESRLTFVAANLRRPRSRELGSLDVAVVKGDAKLALPAGELVAGPGAQVRIDGDPESARIQATARAVRVQSAAQPDASDPLVSAELPAGRELAVRALHAEGVAWFLGDGREVRFGPGRIGATVALDGGLPRVRLGGATEWGIAKDVLVTFCVDQNVRSLRFPSGEKVALAGELRGTIDKASLTLTDGSAIDLADAIEITAAPGDRHVSATLKTRRDDRYELPRGSRVAIGRRRDVTTFRLDDGRALWIENGAPLVQSRAILDRGSRGPSDARADGQDQVTLSYSMPEARPLEVPPGRPLTVLATRAGEFEIIDDPSALAGGAGREGLVPLSGPVRSASASEPFHLPDLLAEPLPASPISGP